MTFDELDRAVDEKVNGVQSPVYTKAVEITKVLNAEIIYLVQQIYDLKEENRRLNNLVDSYKAKSDSLIDSIPVKLQRVK